MVLHLRDHILPPKIPIPNDALGYFWLQMVLRFWKDTMWNVYDKQKPNSRVGRKTPKQPQKNPNNNHENDDNLDFNGHRTIEASAVQRTVHKGSKYLHVLIAFLYYVF